MSSLVDADLPKSVVKRLVKAALDRLDTNGSDGKSLQLNKDALLALSESAKAFILYLTATAAAHQVSARRQTLLQTDVFAALKDVQFDEFVQPLKDELAAEKQKASSKGSAKKATPPAATPPAAAPAAPNLPEPASDPTAAGVPSDSETPSADAPGAEGGEPMQAETPAAADGATYP